MQAELVEKVAGVGAFITAPDAPELGFVSLQELTAKRRTNKLMNRTLPMETVEEGESHEQAMVRLFEEELIVTPLLNTHLTETKISKEELTPGVVLHAYKVDTTPDALIRLGTHAKEVASPSWTPFAEVIHSPHGSFQFRSGVYEVVIDYMGYLCNPERHLVETHLQLRDKVPEEIFDLMDKGLSKTAALSHWRYQKDAGLILPVVAHL